MGLPWSPHGFGDPQGGPHGYGGPFGGPHGYGAAAAEGSSANPSGLPDLAALLLHPTSLLTWSRRWALHACWPRVAAASVSHAALAPRTAPPVV